MFQHMVADDQIISSVLKAGIFNIKLQIRSIEKVCRGIFYPVPVQPELQRILLDKMQYTFPLDPFKVLFQSHSLYPVPRK